VSSICWLWYKQFRCPCLGQWQGTNCSYLPKDLLFNRMRRCYDESEVFLLLLMVARMMLRSKVPGSYLGFCLHPVFFSRARQAHVLFTTYTCGATLDVLFFSRQTTLTYHIVPDNITTIFAVLSIFTSRASKAFIALYFASPQPPVHISIIVVYALGRLCEK
jgi:hypothetical protein